MQPAVSIRGLCKTFRSGSRGAALATPALRDVSLDIRGGEIVGLVGRQGAGKSTLLLCLAGLLRPDHGSITWFGEQITEYHITPGIAYVPQRAGYYSFLTVREALEYYATLHDLSSGQRAAQVEGALRDTCLRIHATRRVSTLTNNLLQRLGLAQSLIGSPRAILLDETICGEGLLFDKDIVSLITRLARLGITIIIAAPNPVELHRITARVINIVEGRIVQPRHEPITRSALTLLPALDVPHGSPDTPPQRVAENREHFSQ